MTRQFTAAAITCGLISICAVASPVSAQLSIFSSGGYTTPETISQIPAGEDDAGDYLIPDFDHSNYGGPVWLLPQSGGTSTEYSSGDPNVALEGGLFLPDSGWGLYSGDYIADGITTTGGAVDAFAPNGSYTDILNVPGDKLTQPVLAPDTFGSYGGDLFITNQSGSVEVVTPSLSASTFVSAPSLGPAGDVFAPIGFGSIGGDLLVDGLQNGEIDAVDASGDITPFADISLASTQTGLRQMAFSPSGFIPGYGSLLFVSISGSFQGGGNNGDVVALNSAGQVVDDLNLPQTYGAFDPRGLDFIGNNQLLINDASDPVDLATPSAFVPAPEFSSIAIYSLMMIGLGLLFAISIRGRRERSCGEITA